MPRRSALATRADIARAIRALQDAGLPVTRVVVRSDGIAIETTTEPDSEALIARTVADEEAQRRKIVL